MDGKVEATPEWHKDGKGEQSLPSVVAQIASPEQRSPDAHQADEFCQFLPLKPRTSGFGLHCGPQAHQSIGAWRIKSRVNAMGPPCEST